MTETSGASQESPTDRAYDVPNEFVVDDDLPPPNNSDTQEEQAAELVEPDFQYHARYETELLTAEFGPPDSDGVYARNPEALQRDPASRSRVEGRTS